MASASPTAGNGHSVIGRNDPIGQALLPELVDHPVDEDRRRAERHHQGLGVLGPVGLEALLGPLDLGVLLGDGLPGLVRSGAGRVGLAPGPGPDLAGLAGTAHRAVERPDSLESRGPKSSFSTSMPTEVWAMT